MSGSHDRKIFQWDAAWLWGASVNSWPRQMTTTLRVWEKGTSGSDTWAAKKPHAELKGHADRVPAVKVSDDGRIAACA